MPIPFNPNRVISKTLNGAIEPKAMQGFIQKGSGVVQKGASDIISFTTDITTQRAKQFTSDSLRGIISEVQKNRYNNGFNILKFTSDEMGMLEEMYATDPRLTRLSIGFLEKNETPFASGFPSMEEFLKISEAYKKNPEFIGHIIPMTRITLEPGMSPLFARRFGITVPRFYSKDITSLSNSYQINPSLTKRMVDEQYKEYESGEMLYTHTSSSIKHFVDYAKKSKKKSHLCEQILGLNKQCKELCDFNFEDLSEQLEQKPLRIANRFMDALSTIKPEEGKNCPSYLTQLENLITRVNKDNIKYFEQICAEYQNSKVIRVPRLKDIDKMMGEFDSSSEIHKLLYRLFG